MTEEEAQKVHQARQAADSDHEDRYCVCCCLDCLDLTFDCIGERVARLRQLGWDQ
jgi:hypothetical protein